MTMRIYSNKWHVYAGKYITNYTQTHTHRTYIGLALLNPNAKIQIRQYAQSVSEIFSLMIQEREQELRERIYKVNHTSFPLIILNHF
jgi:prephenate dehydrogenase (NADP+)